MAFSWGSGDARQFGRFYETLTGQSLVLRGRGLLWRRAWRVCRSLSACGVADCGGWIPDVVAAGRNGWAGRARLLRLILLPLARPGLVAGTTLAFARALGDFGATLDGCGDTPGLTRTMRLPSTNGSSAGNRRSSAHSFSILATAICFGVCVLAAWLAPPRRKR